MIRNKKKRVLLGIMAAAMAMNLLSGCASTKNNTVANSPEVTTEAAADIPSETATESLAEKETETEEELTIDEMLAIALQYLEDLDYENAIVAFKEVCKFDPKNARAYAGLYASYLGSKDDKMANSILGRLSDFGLKKEEILSTTLEFAEEIRNYDTEQANYIEIKTGQAAMKSNLSKVAQTAFQTVLDADSTNEEATEGMQAVKEMQEKEAKQEVSEELFTAFQLMENLDYDQAIEIFKKVLDQDANNIKALAGLYASYLGDGDSEMAESIMEQVEKNKLDQEKVILTIVKLAERIRENDSEQANEIENAAGYVALEKNLIEAAKTAFQTVLDADSTNAEALEGMKAIEKLQSSDQTKENELDATNTNSSTNNTGNTTSNNGNSGSSQSTNSETETSSSPENDTAECDPLEDIERGDDDNGIPEYEDTNVANPNSGNTNTDSENTNTDYVTSSSDSGNQSDTGTVISQEGTRGITDISAELDYD